MFLEEILHEKLKNITSEKINKIDNRWYSMKKYFTYLDQHICEHSNRNVH